MSSEGKRQRKAYLHSDEPFEVPYATKHRRSTRSCDDDKAQPACSRASEPAPPSGSQGSCEAVHVDREEAEATVDTSSDCDTEIFSQNENEADDFEQSSATQGETESEANSADEIDDGEPLPDSCADTAYDEARLLADSFEQFGNETLPNSPTRKVEAILMIMALVVSLNMPWTGLESLLQLINMLFGVKDVLPRSKYLFRKLWKPKTDHVAAHHFYCEECGNLLEQPQPDGTVMCATCNKSFELAKVKSKGCFFTIFSFEEQVRHLINLTKGPLYSNLQKLQNEPDNDTITDATAGALHKHLRKTGDLRWSDLTFNFNTDGSPLFKSSKSSVWPIQFIINELPTNLRFQHCVLSGLWFGPKHPNMAIFLKKFVDSVKSMKEITWKFNSKLISSKVYPLCCCVDAPARAAVQNSTLFNGFFGCPWCLARGEYREGKHSQYMVRVIVSRSDIF